jgi:DNA invertase Pin-like site-specific DNA recombinase
MPGSRRARRATSDWRRRRPAIRAECERRGWKLVGEVREEIKSGSKAANRPVLQEVLAALRRREADAVVVAKLDRLSRSVVDAGKLLYEARRRGYNIVALDFGLDLSTPQGELVANILTSVAQWERRVIGQRTSAALQAKMAQGWKPHHASPLIPAAVTRKILRLHRAGVSQRKIAEHLNAEGVSAIGTRWHRGTIIRVVQAAG